MAHDISNELHGEFKFDSIVSIWWAGGGTDGLCNERISFLVFYLLATKFLEMIEMQFTNLNFNADDFFGEFELELKYSEADDIIVSYYYYGTTKQILFVFFLCFYFVYWPKITILWCLENMKSFTAMFSINLFSLLY